MTLPYSDFPDSGWRFEGSNSYGAAELFRGTPRVLVRTFSAVEVERAPRIHDALKDMGVSSATLDKLVHADRSVHYYVWGERNEMLRCLAKAGVQIEAQGSRASTS